MPKLALLTSGASHPFIGRHTVWQSEQGLWYAPHCEDLEVCFAPLFLWTLETFWNDASDRCNYASFIVSRDINAIICMVITALAAVVVVIYHFREDLPTLHTAYILVIAVILVRKPSYLPSSHE